MKLLKQSKPQCLLYAAAMLLDEEPEALITEIGATGLEVVWPNRTGAARLRGHHIQEIQDCFLRRGFALAPITPCPVLSNIHMDGEYKVWAYGRTVDRMDEYLDLYRGILIGRYENQNADHAVAWENDQAYDPNGEIIPGAEFLEIFKIRELWIVTLVI